MYACEKMWEFDKKKDDLSSNNEITTVFFYNGISLYTYKFTQRCQQTLD